MMQTHDSEGNLLPGLLCLHGGGSNATVFKIQCRRILWALRDQFRFVFVEGPADCEPGIGMLPTFASCAPFYSWTTIQKLVNVGNVDAEVPKLEEAEQIDTVLRHAMDENGGVDSFVGLIGFSQGSRLSAGLLLRQKMLEREGKECWHNFKFGVMIGGPYPPIVITENQQPVVPDRDFPLLKDVPNVQGWGVDDVYKVEAKRLAGIFGGGENSSELVFAGGHHMPMNENDSDQLCDLILAAWDAAA